MIKISKIAKIIQILLLVLLATCSIACSNDENRRPEQSKEMQDAKIKCPDGSHVEYSPWGEVGWEKSCKMNHGKFTAWKGGRIVIDGQFNNGVKTGTWIYYDKNGNIEKTINY